MKTQTRSRGVRSMTPPWSPRLHAPWRGWRTGMATLALVVLAITLPSATSIAQERIGAADRALANRVQQRFDVLPVQNGIVLTPKRPHGDVRSIELSGETVAVNGTVVTGRELRARIGDDADLVLPLSYMDPDTRAELFGFSSTASPSSSEPAPAESAEPPAPPVPPAPEPPPAPGPSRHSGDQVRFGGNINVERGEVVDGDVVAIGGSVRVDGEVRGDVAAIGGTVRLGPEALVDGDVSAVGGTVDRDPRAVVHGEVKTVGIGGRLFAGRHRSHDWFRYGGPFFTFVPFVGFLSSMTRTALLMLLVCLILLVAERPVDTIARRATAEPVKAGLIGIACELLFIPVLVLTIVLLVVTIIGIPLLILVPFAVLAVILVFLVGFTAAAREVGRWVDTRLGLKLQGPFLPAVIGVFAICLLTLVGRLAGSVGSFFDLFAVIFLAIGAFIEWAAWTIGFGAAVLARFGGRLGSSGSTAAVPVTPTTGEAGA